MKKLTYYMLFLMFLCFASFFYTCFTLQNSTVKMVFLAFLMLVFFCAFLAQHTLRKNITSRIISFRFVFLILSILGIYPSYVSLFFMQNRFQVAFFPEKFGAYDCAYGECDPLMIREHFRDPGFFYEDILYFSPVFFAEVGVVFMMMFAFRLHRKQKKN